MDKRTKILGITFAVLIAVWVGYKTVYAWWVVPLVRIEQDIEKLRAQESEAAEFNAQYEFAQKDYEKLVSRVGTLELGELKDDLHHRIEDLAHEYALEDLKVTPKREQRYGKTDALELGFAVSGQQKLESVLGFLREVYELPHVLRVVDPKLSPILPPRGEKAKDLIKLTLDIQALLLPARPRAALAYTVDLKKLPPQPKTFVRHGEPDIVKLASAKPFLEYEPEKPAGSKPPIDTGSKTPKPPDPLVCKPWSGRWRVVAISMMHDPEGASVLVQDTARATNRKRIHIGQEFDGGMLEAASTRGALVRYHDKIYVYPLGEEFSRRVEAGAADAFPDLKEKSAGVAPLTENEIRALAGLAGETVAALSSSSGSSTASSPRSTSSRSGTPPRPPVSTGANAPTSRTTPRPGSLSTSTRIGGSNAGNGASNRTSGESLPARPTDQPEGPLEENSEDGAQTPPDKGEENPQPTGPPDNQ